MERCRQVLHGSRDEPTGQALSKLLAILTARAVSSLLTATDIGDVRALQGEIRAYERLAETQRKPFALPSGPA